MKPLNEDRDAQRWAREFIQLFEGHVVGGPKVDEGLLISWIANAMMCGEDTYRWRQEKSSPGEAEQRMAGEIGKFINASAFALAVLQAKLKEMDNGQEDCTAVMQAIVYLKDALEPSRDDTEEGGKK